MPKQKINVSAIEPLDTLKPIVKDFSDPEKDLSDFIKLRLPYVKNTTVSLIQVYQNKTKTISRYRANYWSFETNDVGISSGNIVKSSLIQIDNHVDGYHLKDITNQKV